MFIVSKILLVSGHTINLLEIRTESTLNNLYPVLQVDIHPSSIHFHGQHVFHVSKKNNEATTILRKWIPFCLSVDFEKQFAKVAYNGILSEKVERKDLNNLKPLYKNLFGGPSTETVPGREESSQPISSIGQCNLRGMRKKVQKSTRFSHS